MKRIFLIILFYSFTQISYTQNVSVEPSIWGIQTGLLGIWVHNEIKFTNDIALRGEIGLDMSFWSGTDYPKDIFALGPGIRFEPRWYYNLDKRKMNSKNTLWNSGNYLTIQFNFHSNLGVISNADNLYIPAQLSIIPSWGLRRSLRDRFNYELGFGYGPRFILDKNNRSNINLKKDAYNIILKIGYRIK